MSLVQRVLSHKHACVGGCGLLIATTLMSLLGPSALIYVGQAILGLFGFLVVSFIVGHSIARDKTYTKLEKTAYSIVPLILITLGSAAWLITIYFGVESPTGARIEVSTLTALLMITASVASGCCAWGKLEGPKGSRPFERLFNFSGVYVCAIMIFGVIGMISTMAF